MKIVLKIDGSHDEAPLEVPEGTTVEQLLENLNPDDSQDHFTVRVNRQAADLCHILRAGDRVRIVQKERLKNPED